MMVLHVSFRCNSDVCNGLKSALQHISTFRALAGIREAVHTLLSHRPGHRSSGEQPSELELAQAREEWAKITHNALGEDFSVWNSFLRPLILQRAKVCQKVLYCINSFFFYNYLFTCTPK